MQKLCALIGIVLSVLLEAACSSPQNLAPVVELHWKANNVHQSRYRVQRGDTLYSIAFRYDKDYRLLADYNRLRSPYTLKVGQIIYLQYLEKRPHQFYAPVQNLKQAPNRMPGRLQVPVFRPAHKHMPRPVLVPSYRPSRTGSAWVWPVNGRVVSGFVPSQGKKGIDIAGKQGDLVRASAGGVVAYSGSGLAGYGNLIIIKHEGQYLSAYGNNFRNRVQEGQKVRAGEIIAEMGKVDRKFWGVHFEIRKAGQPVNPMQYLH